MKGKQTALFPGTDDRVGYWRIPPEIMEPLDAEFRFNFDPCPYPRPAGFDGLKESWGSSNWVNPPFRSGLIKWARKAVDEANLGKRVVMIAPLDSWFEVLCLAGAEIRHMGWIEWMNPKGKRRKSPRPHFLFVLRGGSP